MTRKETPAENDRKLVDISRKSFVSVLILLAVLMAVSIILTYVIPGSSGIPVFRGIAAPFLILGSSDGLSIIMLSLFLLVIVGTFQAMNDSAGIKVIVERIIHRFHNRRFLLISITALLFMLLGAMLGLFEEMLTLLPIMIILSVSLGYDSFTGFLISIVACGFGFSSAITNPFTVLFASEIIGVNPMTNVWYRIIIFITMFALIELVIFLYTRKIARNPESSFTYERDQRVKKDIFREEQTPNEKRVFLSYLLFFACDP